MYLLKKTGLSFQLLLAILVATTLLGVYFYSSLKGGETRSPQENTYTSTLPQNISPQKSAESNTSKKNEASLPATAVPQSPNTNVDKYTGTPSQQQELKDWKLSRGYYDFSNNNKDDYKSYSREELEKLGNNGDLKALLILAMSKAGDDAKYWLTKSAIYGSSFALDVLAINNMNSPPDQNATDAQRRKVAIETAAYPYVAKLRQDYFSSNEPDKSSIETKFNIKFTAQDEEAIKQKAKEIYADLEAQRIQLGLGEFDNNLPHTVELYFKASGDIK